MQIYLPIAEVSVNAFLLLGLGGIVGILSGMFGVGGGFLMTPLLFFIGIPPAVAVATEANQIVASSFSGALAHLKRKTVDLRMGTVLLAGGLAGAALGIQIFNILKGMGQVDLLVRLCYVVFLGIIGALMFVESLGAIRRRGRPGAVPRRRKHNWVHNLPFKVKFRTSGLYISAIPPLAVGVLVGMLAAIMGVGGGFVMTETELGAPAPDVPTISDHPYPFDSAARMLEMARESGLSVSAMKRANELARLNSPELDRGLGHIWNTMNACIERGLSAVGILPGGLSIPRRAGKIHEALLAERGSNAVAPHTINDWISVYAMAVNEENAAGGQVVTAPTNGAAGVIPAVIRYWLDHVPGADADGVGDFLLTAAAIGGLIKHNASISGAECGCQAEVGSASAMAAAGLCAVMGGTPEQVENAAEIALEHHLGLTCDPVKGLVQAPCIERNGMGAVKAVSASSLALRGDGHHLIPLDNAIETMRQTGRDMNEKYKETSMGGLAVNVPNC